VSETCAALGMSGGALLLPGQPRRLSLHDLFFFFFFDLDAEGFEELEVLVADFEFGVGGEGGDERSLVGGFLALLADADGGFEDQEDVVTAFLDAGDDFGDLFGIGERLVDSLAEFLHELFELLIHLVPRSPSALALNNPHQCLDACGR
jgi:hypothetical protein